MCCFCCESLNSAIRVVLAVLLFAILVVILGYPLKAWSWADDNNPSSSEMADYLSSSEFWTFDEQNLLLGLAAATLIYGVVLGIALIIWSLCASCTCVLSFFLACIPWTWRKLVVKKTADLGHAVRGEARKPTDGLYELDQALLSHRARSSSNSYCNLEEGTVLQTFHMGGPPGYSPGIVTSIEEFPLYEEKIIENEEEEEENKTKEL